MNIVTLTKGPWILRKSIVPGSCNYHIYSKENPHIAVACKKSDATAISNLPDLITCAQAVIDRWETPLWKDVEPTAAVIYRLRDALEKFK